VNLETKEFDLGGSRFLRDGEILSDSTLDELRQFDAILLGAVGTPDVPPGVIERGLLLKMRFDLDLYINQRPFAGVAPGHTKPHDFVVIRENTEGPYVGEGGVLRKGTPNEVATQGSVNTRVGVERCVRYAFELASKRERKHVTLVHKTNVLTFAGDLWQRTFDFVAKEYPQVGTAYNHVDAACIYFVQDPHRYDVIVTDNLFGDILTDLGGAVSGGVGLASSANLNPARTGPSMFEPVHGSAPDIAGQNKANPIAAVLSAALMLDFLGESSAADRIRKACDQEHSGTTTGIGDAIVAALK
jgi:3-isopropylmalate dehydrogenase